MKSKLFITAILVTLIGNACGNKTHSEHKSAQNAGITDSGWSIQHLQSPDGSVQIDKSKIDPSQLIRVQNQYRRSDLIQLSVDAKFNAVVLRITDNTIAEYQNKAFIAPKLYSYSTQDGSKLVPIHHADGTVTLAFNVVFLDGVSKSVLTPAADGTTLNVPDFFRVKYPDELTSTLKNLYQVDNGLSPLPGCPKQLTLEAAGKEYDVTPSVFAKGNFCQLDTPTTVTLTVSEEEAKIILEIALYAHTVDLHAVYETRVAYPTSKVSIHFDRSKIYNDLKVELGYKPVIADVEVKAAVTKVLENQLMTVTEQGEDTAYRDRLVDEVVANFFEPLNPTPGSPDSAQCTGKVCLQLSASHSSQSDTLDFNYVDETNLLAGENYITTTKLKATPKMVSIGNTTSCSIKEFGECNRLTNNGNPRETGLTVVSGNQIMIEPTLILREKRNNLAPEVRRKDNQVCRVPIKDPCEKIADVFGHCPICTDPENQWSETTNYSIGSVAPDVLLNPVGQMDQLFEGLAFQFKWFDQAINKPVTLECPLSAFPREGDGKSLVIRVQNIPSCSPFQLDSSHGVMLSIVNHISFPETYLSGTKIQLWNGTVTQQPSELTFNPKVDFAGTISIQGYSFESERSSGTIR